MSEHYSPKKKKTNKQMEEVCRLRMEMQLPCRRCMYCDECEEYLNKKNGSKGDENGN